MSFTSFRNSVSQYFIYLKLKSIPTRQAFEVGELGRADSHALSALAQQTELILSKIEGCGNHCTRFARAHASASLSMSTQ
jgi:hypothetical protein